MFRKIVGIILILIGLIGVSCSLMFRHNGESDSKKQVENFISNASFENREFPYEEEFVDGVVGVITIPAIDLEYTIAVGTTDEILKKSIGYFEGTALPGEEGNFCIAGHRNSSYAKFFNRLDELKNGDLIYIKTQYNSYIYEVYRSVIIDETKTDILASDNEGSIITLITCTNGYKPKNRIVVQGKLIS